MKTFDLIAILADSARAVEPNAVVRRYTTAIGWGAFGATLLMAIMLGVRQDIFEVAQQLMFWIKLAFPASLALGAMVAVARLSRPGAKLGWSPAALVAPVLAMWALGIFALMKVAPAARQDLILGVSWSTCPFSIAILSMPVFVAAMWAMKGLAPTRPTLAGAAVGLLAGAIGALVYALYCIEMAAPFIGIWYVVGMSIPTAVGALVGDP